MRYTLLKMEHFNFKSGHVVQGAKVFKRRLVHSVTVAIATSYHC